MCIGTTTIEGQYKNGRNDSDFAGAIATGSSDALLAYFRNLAARSAADAGGSGAVTYISNSGAAVSLSLSVLLDAATGATTTEIIISNGLATLAVKVAGLYTGTQNPAV